MTAAGGLLEQLRAHGNALDAAAAEAFVGAYLGA